MPEMIMVFVVILLLIGAKKLPELARGIGKSMGEFKKARDDFEREITRAETELALTGQTTEPPRAAGGEKLSASVARHLARYFDLHGGALPPPGLYDRILREIELPLIEIALDATGGNQAKCADLLGINRNTLRKKITDLDIRVTRRRKLM